jgi:hypothetical protein
MEKEYLVAVEKQTKILNVLFEQLLATESRLSAFIEISNKENQEFYQLVLKHRKEILETLESSYPEVVKIK